MLGQFIWNELATTDVDKAKDFYEQILGWTFEAFELPDGAYWVAKAGDTIVGGLGGMSTAADPQAKQSAWFVFVEVDDVDVRVDKARTLCADVLQPPHDVPNVGRVAVLRDPTGAVIGLMAGLSQ